MILVLLRNRTSYFRPYRHYFVAIYAAFLVFPIRELLTIFIPAQFPPRFSVEVLIVPAISIAMLWGHLATRLYLYPIPFSLKQAFTKPSKPIHFGFLLYTVPMVTILAAVFLLPGAVQDIPVKAAYFLSQDSSPTPRLSAEFLAIGVTVLIAFVSYPFTVLVIIRSQLKDPEVRYALRTISTSFGVISALIFVVNASASLGFNLASLAYSASVALLAIVDRAFSRPNFLKAFLGLVPGLESRYAGKRPDMRVLIYKKEEEKFGPLARFVNEGVNQDSLVVYFYRGDAMVVRDGLSREGFASKQPLMKRNLRFTPFSSLYEDEERLDEEAALTFISGLKAEAKALGKNGLRIIVDYEEHSERSYSRFVDHLADPRWTSTGHYVWVLMAFSEEAFRGQESTLTLLRSKIDTLDLSDVVDTFSKSVGLSHSDIAGKKILLEYDPLSEYERILKSLLSEAYSNFERSVVFTRKDSPVYAALGEQTGAKMFLLTPRVSYPRVEEENRVLLPVYDSSLQLDALNKTIEAYAGASFTIIFDGISHFIFTLGPDRALSLVRQAMELMVSSKVTAVFLINGNAHDKKTVSSFENLFDIEIFCSAGTRVPRVRRSLSLEASR